MQEEVEKTNFYEEFKDTTLNLAKRRGAQAPTWDDVLIATSRIPKIDAVLSDRGVHTPDVVKDIRYSLLFGRPGSMDMLANFSLPSIYRDASRTLMRDIRAYYYREEFWDDPANRERREAFRSFDSFLSEHLRDIREDLDNPQATNIARIKHGMLIEAVRGFQHQLRDSGESANGQTEVTLKGLMSYMEERDRIMLAVGNPIAILDRVAGSGLTPFRLVEATEQYLDPFLKYILYRNGLETPKKYEPPCRMPEPTIINYGLAAFSFVERHRLETVLPVHILPDLLTDPEVLAIIRELDKDESLSEREEDTFVTLLFEGRRGRNFIKLRESIVDQLVPQKGDEERFRHRPDISGEMRRFLVDVNPIVTKGLPQLASARLMGILLKDPDIKKMMIKAGLTATQIKGWDRVTRGRVKKKEEDKKIKGKAVEDKVDDRELNNLLEKYSVDLTKAAIEGKLDPVIGREEEIRQIMRILLQRGRSNPLLLGEQGVGKTVLFDGLALAIASGNAPTRLIGAKVVRLDLAAMNSGAMFRGQFEGRLLPIIKGVAERNSRGDEPLTLLCIDEVHSALDAGTASGTPGAGELLKPYLTRGDLSITGATTQSDFARHIEPDAALTRRFQTVFIDEPKPEQTVKILQGLKDRYAGHHQIEVDDSTLELIVSLSDRYLPNQHQPDKAIVILDAACARAKMMDASSLTLETIYNTIAVEAKIDPEFLQVSDNLRYLKLRDELPKHVLGQDRATTAIAEALIRAKADLNDPRKPLGVFLLLGPTGVGKTETARVLAKLLHGTEDALIREDMSDYQERHEGAKLVGAPPGYVGFGEEGKLTGAVRRRPYSVVVLDELEKADPEVMRRFLPVFEEGEITDGRGQKISFRNTVILMTSNLGVREASRHMGFVTRKDYDVDVLDAIFEKAAQDFLAPELRNRLDRMFIYHPLSREVIRQLVGREFESISQRVSKRWGVNLSPISKDIADQLAQEGYSVEYGARELKRVVQKRLSDTLSTWLLEQSDNLIRGSQVTIAEENGLFVPQLLS